MSGNEPDCDCSKCGCSLESDAYARGKADGLEEWRKKRESDDFVWQDITEAHDEGRDDELAKVVAWLRTKVATQDCDLISRVIGEAADQFADALERKEHRK